MWDKKAAEELREIRLTLRAIAFTLIAREHREAGAQEMSERYQELAMDELGVKR